MALFSGKAFHIDDPAYLWTAQHIVESPLDFYGFRVNWGGSDVMMFEANRNPPGVSYYMALGGVLFGWGERAQHLWMGVFASLLGVAAFLLARRVCARPLFATLLVISMPVVVVSSTTLMADVPMLALYTLGVALWIAGMERGRSGLLAAACLCAASAFMMKYFGITLLALFFVHGLMHTRRIGRWCLPLLLPIVAAAGYLAWAYHLYGINPLVEAASYASGAAQNEFSYVRAKPLIGVVFTGGCLSTAAVYAPVVWRRGAVVGGVFGGAALCLVIARYDGYFLYKAAATPAERYVLSIHYAVFLLGGVAVFITAVRDLARARDANAVLLFCWFAGAFVFATFLNWSVTARTILPMAVPAGLLAARALESAAAPIPPMRRWLPLLPASALALWVAYGDYAAAHFARRAAEDIIAEDDQHPGRYWFMGHWGYQYYLESSGRTFLTEAVLGDVQPGDRVASARWLTLFPSRLNPDVFVLAPNAGFSAANPVHVSTHHPVTRSGFYTSALGPLPFTLGPAPDAVVDVLEYRPATASSP